jgi:hypothetical protein
VAGRGFDLAAIKDVDPADKGDTLNRLYQAVEAISQFAEQRVTKLRMRRPEEAAS